MKSGLLKGLLSIVVVICGVLLSALRGHVAVFATESTDTGRPIVLRLIDGDFGQSCHGIIRVTRRSDNEPVRLPSLIPRGSGWYTTTPTAELVLPNEELLFEAVRGIETELARFVLDAGADLADNTVTLRLSRFSNLRARGWRNGNTHLHVMDRSRVQADRYLREVPVSDDLDLVYLSHLRRIPDETSYISNEIVEEGLTGDTFDRLSTETFLIRPGEEHRHNFGRGGEGFGHVMLLDIVRLIRPVSIGPGIMRQGTDGIPLQRGIRQAREDGATVVWCHNALGFEDIPNWLAGTVHAQNIFDGGDRGSYKDTFYRYLNIGMRIPFSTGTDWFIDDFSRVYVPLKGRLTSPAWLSQLREGRSFITNGPLLEFTVDDHEIGDTLNLQSAADVQVVAKCTGRVDFGRLELVRNGEVIATAEATAVGGHFETQMTEQVLIDEPCWLAVRTMLDAEKNELGMTLHAHTSPVYCDFAGERPFDPTVALELIAEIREGIQAIRVQAAFGNDEEMESVMQVYRNGLQVLQQMIDQYTSRSARLRN